MKNYIYAVCPHCEHPNVHVENGCLKTHTKGITSDAACIGSGITPKATRTFPLNRHLQEFRDALALEQSDMIKAHESETPPAFIVWEFSGIKFIAVPIDRGNFHIADVFGNNYGAWMTIEKFRKRQSAGVLSEWAPLGKAHLQVVHNRS